MATCEMCGDNGDLKKTKVEGTTLKLCEDCQEVGEVVETGEKNKQQIRSKKSSSRKSQSSTRRREMDDDSELVEDFSRRVKQARETAKLGVKDLAAKVKEKDSVIRRVESGKLSPNRKLAQKLEGALNITLYEKISDISTSTEESAASEQTLGDVAEVKEKD